MIKNENILAVSKLVKQVSGQEEVTAPGSLLLKTIDILLNMAVQVDKTTTSETQYNLVINKLEVDTFKSVMKSLGFEEDSKKVLNLLRYLEKSPSGQEITAFIKVPQNRPSDTILKLML